MPDICGNKSRRGRPIAYKKKYADMAIYFFEQPFFDPVQEVWYFPTVFRFAKKLGVCRKTIYNWMDENPDFKEIIDDCIENVREMRIAFASCGKIDPKFAKFVLCADYGMREKPDDNDQKEVFTRLDQILKDLDKTAKEDV